MFYRVDLLVAALVVGGLAAFFVRRQRLGAVYLGATLGVIAAQVGLFALGAVYATFPIVSGVAGIFATTLVGAAMVLRGADVLLALRLATGIGFVTSALAKGFAMDFMVGFFAQSGYSIAFLKFIMLAELVGGLVLVLPFPRLALAAAAGLAMNMFGAIVTHVHNGDPLDDSTGAIGMLVKLGLIGVLAGRARTTALVGAAALAAAALGAPLLRAPAAAPPPPSRLESLVGDWHCSGTFASGKAIEADLHVERDAGLGGILLVRHDDRPPNAYHALGLWRETAGSVTVTLQDNFGGVRLFQAPGLADSVLTLEGGAVGAPADQRFIYELRSAVTLGIRYETLKDGLWKVVDTSTCTRMKG